MGKIWESFKLETGDLFEAETVIPWECFWVEKVVEEMAITAWECGKSGHAIRFLRNYINNISGGNPDGLRVLMGPMVMDTKRRAAAGEGPMAKAKKKKAEREKRQDKRETIQRLGG